MNGLALTLLSILILAQTGCSRNKAVYITPIQQEMICKATVASLMGTDHLNMDSLWLSSYVQVSYIRKSDRTNWTNDCKFDQKNGIVVWRGVDIDYPGSGPGRWRDGDYDSKIYYKVNDDKVEITEKYYDGSFKNKEFEFK